MFCNCLREKTSRQLAQSSMTRCSNDLVLSGLGAFGPLVCGSAVEVLVNRLVAIYVSDSCICWCPVPDESHFSLFICNPNWTLQPLICVNWSKDGREIPKSGTYGWTAGLRYFIFCSVMSGFLFSIRSVWRLYSTSLWLALIYIPLLKVNST